MCIVTIPLHIQTAKIWFVLFFLRKLVHLIRACDCTSLVLLNTLYRGKICRNFNQSGKNFDGEKFRCLETISSVFPDQNFKFVKIHSFPKYWEIFFDGEIFVLPQNFRPRHFFPDKVVYQIKTPVKCSTTNCESGSQISLTWNSLIFSWPFYVGLNNAIVPRINISLGSVFSFVLITPFSGVPVLTLFSGVSILTPFSVGCQY